MLVISKLLRRRPTIVGATDGWIFLLPLLLATVGVGRNDGIIVYTTEYCRKTRRRVGPYKEEMGGSLL